MAYIVCQAFKHRGAFLQPGEIIEDLHELRQWRMLVARRVVREIPVEEGGKEVLRVYFKNKFGMTILSEPASSQVVTPQAVNTAAPTKATVKPAVTAAKPTSAAKATPAKAVTKTTTGTK